MPRSMYAGNVKHRKLLIMTFILKPFNKLSIQQFFEIYKLRQAVFVVEQNCPYQDIDEKDHEAYHLLMMDHDTLAAYCRILPPGVSYRQPSIGRVVVNKDYRGKGLGRDLMKNSINQTIELFQDQEIIISAQTYLIKFYTDLGFTSEGSEYLEDDIPHIKMKYIVK